MRYRRTSTKCSLAAQETNTRDCWLQQRILHEENLLVCSSVNLLFAALHVNSVQFVRRRAAALLDASSHFDCVVCVHGLDSIPKRSIQRRWL